MDIFVEICIFLFKVGLAEKLAELEAEKEEKIRNSFVVRSHFDDWLNEGIISFSPGQGLCGS